MEVAMEIEAAAAALAVAVATACSAPLCLFPVAASARDRVVRLNDHFEFIRVSCARQHQERRGQAGGRGEEEEEEG